MDINKELFKRNKPKKKLELIEMLTPSELLGIHPGTILRIVKEVGVLRYKSRDRELRLSNRTGNNWNSSVESIGVYKNRLFINIYIQMDHTEIPLLLKKGKCSSDVVNTWGKLLKQTGMETKFQTIVNIQNKTRHVV